MASKVALVTGCSKGIGKEITLKLLKEGVKVYGIARSKNLLDDISKQFNNFTSLTGDLNDEDFVFEVVTGIKKKEKNLDYLINNAAIEKNEPIGMISMESLKNMLSTNVVALINLLQLAQRIMQNGGSIINISSNVGLKGNPGQMSYSATKGAVNAVTLTAAKELAPKGIRVNAVLPGLTNTEMIKNTDERFLKNRIENISLGRMVTPEEVADLVVFLCSDSAQMISGQLIAVDGCTIM